MYRTIDSKDLAELCTEGLIEAGLTNFTRDVIVPKGNSGTRHRVTFKLHDLATNIHGSSIIPTLNFLNSYDGKSALKIGIGLYRMVCSNGLMVGEEYYSEKIIHREGPKVDKFLRELADKIRIAAENMQDILQQLDTDTSRPSESDKQIEIVGSLPIPKKAKENTIRQLAYGHRRELDRENNVWSLWNIVNENMRQVSRSRWADANNNMRLLEDITLLAA